MAPGHARDNRRRAELEGCTGCTDRGMIFCLSCLPISQGSTAPGHGYINVANTECRIYDQQPSNPTHKYGTKPDMSTDTPPLRFWYLTLFRSWHAQTGPCRVRRETGREPTCKREGGGMQCIIACCLFPRSLGAVRACCLRLAVLGHPACQCIHIMDCLKMGWHSHGHL